MGVSQSGNGFLAIANGRKWQERTQLPEEPVNLNRGELPEDTSSRARLFAKESSKRPRGSGGTQVYLRKGDINLR